jgi:hypothetical protein
MMKKRIFTSVSMALLAILFTGNATAAAQPNGLLKALKDIDRSVCKTFGTCKAKAKPKPKLQVRKNKVRTPAPAKETTTLNLNDVMIEAPPKKIKVAPPIPKAKPVLKPEDVAVVPLPPMKPVLKSQDVAVVPLPHLKPQKPATVIAPTPAVIPSVNPPKDVSSNDADKNCLEQLRQQGVEFSIATDVVDSGQCHVQNPVHLKSLKTSKNVISLPESPLLNCQYALQFSKWLGESAAPIMATQLNTPLEKVSTGPGYDCRGRNGDTGAKLSEHGRGNAVDVTTFSMKDGKVVNVADAPNTTSPSYTVLRGLRASACGYFTTVLGPGSNSAHATHFHFDLGMHGKSANYRICE